MALLNNQGQDPGQLAVILKEGTGIEPSFWIGHLAGFIVGADYDGNLHITCAKCNRDDELGQELLAYRPTIWPHAWPLQSHGQWLANVVTAALQHRCDRPEGPPEVPEGQQGRTYTLGEAMAHPGGIDALTGGAVKFLGFSVEGDDEGQGDAQEAGDE